MHFQLLKSIFYISPILKVKETKLQEGKLFGLFHYVGWPDSENEWRAMDGLIEISRYPAIHGAGYERLLEFKHRLLYTIKTNLIVSKLTDPIVKFSLPVGSDLVEKLVVKGLLYKDIGEVRHFKVLDNNLLNTSIQRGWWYRIISENGDFAYIVQGTFSFHFKQSKMCSEYKWEGEGRLGREQHLREYRIEAPSNLHISFTKGQGPSFEFFQEEWTKAKRQ